MGWYDRLNLVLSLMLAMVMLSGEALAQSGEESARKTPVLAELFTSQGCSSCPPAERFFAELADDPDVVTLEWHVDYWDDLVHGGSRWKDPFSSAAATERQRRYNASLRNTHSVYTPQAIIQGAAEMTGSFRGEIRAAIDAAPRADVDLMLQMRDGGVSVTLAGEGRGRVMYVRLQKAHQTDVTAGENKGRKLVGRNIVLDAQVVGVWKGGDARFDAPLPEPGESCAVIVQSEERSRPGQALAARYCPG